MVEVVATHTEQAEAERRVDLRSFDMLASVDMLRFDLQMYNEVLPETARRVLDEELSYMAEGMDRPMRSEFIFQEQNNDMVYFDRGEYRSYVGMLVTGLEIAQLEALADPRKGFLVEKAAKDLPIGHALCGLQPGESLTWDSEFPDEACGLYGTAFVSSLGFQPKRRMGFLYHAEKNEDHSLTLVSQSVDNSETWAFAAARRIGEAGGDMDVMLAAYDKTMMDMYGATYYAGRRSDMRNPENAWTALQRHEDLHGRYMERLVQLAADTERPRAELELAKKRLTYGVWAALKTRLDVEVLAGNPRRNAENSAADVDREIFGAYRNAIQLGEVLFGCGGTLSEEEMEALLLAANPADVLSAILGDTLPAMLRCTECRRESPKGDVVQAATKSWRCPHCTYEIDVCTGSVLNKADLARAHETLFEEVTGILAETCVSEGVTMDLQYTDE